MNEDITRKELRNRETSCQGVNPERNGGEVQVAYHVPVEVIVDLDSRRVVRVVVLDDQIARNKAEGVRRFVPEERGPVDAPTSTAAISIAEDPQAPWPAWELGF